MNPLRRAVRLIYQGGMWVDRKRQEGGKLSRPVVSIGNISFGGRCKTPFTVYLAQGLRERGFEPVVLTRGYGRQSSRAMMLIPERLSLQELKRSTSLKVSETGDEPLEIFLRADCPVLISKNRRAFAAKFLKLAPPLRWIFLLDDGFQHWDLERDFDLVLLSREDLNDQVFPEGGLREGQEALDRADLALEQDTDFTKTTILRAHPPLGEMLGVLTTRAGSQAEYFDFFKEQFERVVCVELPDHAPVSKVMAQLHRNKVKHWALGLKEAVKVLDDVQLKDFMADGKVRIHQGPLRDCTFYFCDWQLQIRDVNSLWSKLLEKVRVSELLS